MRTCSIKGQSMMSRICDLRFIGLFLRPQPSFLVRSSFIHLSGVNQNIVKSKYQDVELSTESYFNYVFSTRQVHGHRTVLTDGVTGASLTNQEVYQKSKNFGYALQSQGVKKNDVLAILLPNCIEYPIIFCGASGTGVVSTTINPAYTPLEIKKQLSLSKAKYAVTSPELLPKLRQAIDDGFGDWQRWKWRIFITGDGSGECGSFNQLIQDDFQDDFNVDIDVKKDLALLPFSSGTTGVPKGVMLTHFNLVANASQVSRDDNPTCTLVVLPLFHLYALNATMTPALHSGCNLVMLPKFEPQSYVTALKKYKPTFLHLAPPLVSFLANHDQVQPEDLALLDHIVAAAAPSGPSLIQRFKSKAPHCVYREGWGMTETGPTVMFTALNDEVNGSVGVLVPNTEAKIIDPDSGEVLGPHQPGELCCRGPQMMAGYLDNPEATANTLKEDGWLHSGDIAYYDESGHFYLVDRLKELIKVKGYQVPPAELEDILRSHDKVQDVAVIGIPDESHGEVPRAYIVKKEGQELDPDQIHLFMKDKVAPFKQLAGGIEMIQAIPKSAAGKILRKDLRALYKSQKK